MNKAQQLKKIADKKNCDKFFQEKIQKTYSLIIEQAEEEAKKGFYSYSIPYSITLDKELFSRVEELLRKDGFFVDFEYDFEDGYSYWGISWDVE